MRRRMPVVPLIAVMLAAATALATAPVASAATIATSEVVPVPTSGSLTVSGRGFGHGIGMSQYGALARARAGSTYQEILDFYYPQTVLRTQSNTDLRVLISGDTDNVTQVTGSNMKVSVDGRTAVAISPQGTAYRATRDAAGLHLQVQTPSGWVTATTPAAGTTSLTFENGASDTLSLVTGTATAPVTTSYRGKLQALADGASPGLKTVNVVPMESYLRSVVPAESLSSWDAAALQAQAVAARTYASFERAAAAEKTAAWDLCDTPACQVYKGRSTTEGGVATLNEATTTDAAITKTANVIVAYDGAPAFTQFSSSNGGWTTAGQFPYLPAKADTADSDAVNQVSPWSAQLTAAQIATTYPAIGAPKTIEVLHRNGNGTWGGRVVDVRLTGAAGEVTVTGSAFASSFGLRSSWWRVSAPFTTVPKPTISGTASPASVLTANPGTWSPAPDTLSYQWLLGGTAIAGATAKTYTVKPTDQGKSLSVRVTGSKTDYINASSTSAAKAVPWAKASLFTLSPDLNGDGRGDALAVRGGLLVMYPATTSGTLGSGKVLGSGFAGQQVYAPGDWNGDRKADVITVRSDGLMFLYAGTGKGTLGTAKQIGNGWTGFRVVPAGDLTADGRNDLLAITSTGDLRLYAGNGTGGFRSPYPKVGNGWKGFDLYAAGDITKDGRNDILSVDARGALWAYAGRGNGTFLSKKQVGNGWGAYTLGAGADLNGDKLSDIVGRDDATGTLYFYGGRGGGFFYSKKAIAGGW